MNIAGVIFFIGSWVFIIGLCVFCFYKVFTKKKIT